MSESRDCCPVCGQRDVGGFFGPFEAPVLIGVQWKTPEEALNCTKGELRPAFCPHCGFVWNTAFDSDKLEYSQSYDNSLDFSETFRSYARDLGHRLIERYGIRGKRVMDIGCGKGNFLALLCEEGNNWGIGFDPAYEGSRVESKCGDRLTFIPEYYSEKHSGSDADLICCRHVLEHIGDPVGFLGMVRRALGGEKESVVYFEVPNVTLILKDLSIWDIIYEHCNYFSVESLGYLFEKCGFEIQSLKEGYQGQFLGVEAKPNGNGRLGKAGGWGDLEGMGKAVRDFDSSARKRIDAWRTRVSSFGASGTRAVIWGAGAKTVGFLNMLQVEEEISYAVDINPHKQGRFLAGTGQRIVAPEFLRSYQPDLVILMNPVYHDEVVEELGKLGVSGDVVCA